MTPLTAILLSVCLLVICILYCKLRKIRGFGRPLIMLGVLFFTLSMVVFPQESFEAAKAGLDLWLTRVFPALLPFFIGSEILIGLGMVKLMGAVMEPAMRPIFNVPGIGSFIFLMSISSGYPVGAMLTAQLRKQNLCSQVEGERLITFCNTSGPLFMFGAVAVGMFQLPQVGIIIALSHYAACIMVGYLFRFYGRSKPTKTPDSTHSSSLSRILSAYRQACHENNRPFGALLGDSVRHGVNTILLIGGFIIFFSVFLRILSIIGALSVITAFFTKAALLVGLAPQLGSILSTGFFEITLGSKAAAESSIPLLQQLIATSAIISWSGLSVHAQVASIISETDIRYKPYFWSRILHSISAGIITYLLIRFTPLAGNLSAPVSTFPFSPGTTNVSSIFIASLEIFLSCVIIFILSTILFISVKQTLFLLKELKRISRG